MSIRHEPQSGGTDKRRTSPAVTLFGLAALGAGLALWYCGQDPSGPLPALPKLAVPAPELLPSANAATEPTMPTATTSAAAVAIALVDVIAVPRGRPHAVLRINGGPPQTYAWGDVVSVGVRLSRVLPTGVELQRANAVEWLPLNAAVIAPSRALVAESAESPERADTSSIIARRADQAAPSSTAIERAIQRSVVQ